MTKDTVKVPHLKPPKAPDAPGTDNPDGANDTAATEKETKPAQNKTIKVLYVVAKREGFRRAGFAFSAAERTRLLVHQLTEEQVKQLLNEPMLVVTETTVQDESAEISAQIAAADVVGRKNSD